MYHCKETRWIFYVGYSAYRITKYFISIILSIILMLQIWRRITTSNTAQSETKKKTMKAIDCKSAMDF